MPRIQNDIDTEVAQITTTANRLHLAMTTGEPVKQNDAAWLGIVSAARLAWLTGEGMTAAIADEAIDRGVQLTEGQMWAATQEAQTEPR